MPPPPLSQNLALALMAAGLLFFFLYSRRFKRFPASLVVLSFGLGIGLFTGSWGGSGALGGMPILALPATFFVGQVRNHTG